MDTPAEAGLPTSPGDAMDDQTRFDEDESASPHDGEAMALVGEDVGTPTIKSR